MIIEEVDIIKYKEFIHTPYHIFASADFNDLNKSKADYVYYLLFKDTKYRLGIIGGVREGIFTSPFSAPFGGFVYIHPDIRIQEIEEAVDCLVQWCNRKNIAQISITLPPYIYAESYISKLTNIFSRKDFLLKKYDLNYHFALSKFDENYVSNIWRNARKNLNRALSNQLLFSKCEDIDSKKEAYEVIKKNRDSRGFPLRLTWEQVEETTRIIEADFFLVKDSFSENIAAAVIFRINETIAQVIYWGDIPEFAHLKTMNFLSYKVFEYYAKTGYSVLDIGPSSENSIPNYGLCEFKEGIGCNISLKMSYWKDI